LYGSGFKFEAFMVLLMCVSAPRSRNCGRESEQAKSSPG
jgi:hypothetical protein